MPSFDLQKHVLARPFPVMIVVGLAAVACASIAAAAWVTARRHC